MAPLRSWMFVPGNKERYLQKALDGPADAVLLDLEDGVIPDAKDRARQMVAEALSGRPADGPEAYVRLNAMETPWFIEDIAAVLVPGISGVCMPKVQDAATVIEMAGILTKFEVDAGLELGTTRIVAAIESAAALQAAASIAQAHPRLAAIMFGAEDCALDLGLGTQREAEAAQLTYARSAIVIAAAAARVLSVDGVFPDLDDPEGLWADVLSARRLGFSSKSTFNPRQLDVINEIFSPRPDELAYARRVVEGFEAAEAAGDASVAVGGQLVDLPIVRRAQRLLQEVGEWSPERGRASDDN